MKITRFGHSSVLVEASGTRLLIDPGGFSPDAAFELDDLHGIVVTHQHPDHLDASRIGGLLERNPAATLLCDTGTADIVESGDWTPHSDGDETPVGGLRVRGVGTQHAEIVPQLPRVPNTGVLVSADHEPTFFHPGDSYETAPEGVDILGIPLVAPWTKISETIDFIHRVSPTTVFPIHDGAIVDAARGLYWGHVMNFGGVEDARQLGPTESTSVG